MEQPKKATPMKLEELIKNRKALRNVQKEHRDSMTGMDKLAVAITDKVGSMGFFLIIFAWTVIWVGYNVTASVFPGLHMKPFDPFPAFVAYLLISNVIQILLMPLIMLGQNVQARVSDKRAESDLEINTTAEKEIEVVLMHLEHQNDLLMELVKAQGIKIDAAVDIANESLHKINAGNEKD